MRTYRCRWSDPSKLNVAGSRPVSRSKLRHVRVQRHSASRTNRFSRSLRGLSESKTRSLAWRADGPDNPHLSPVVQTAPAGHEPERPTVNSSMQRGQGGGVRVADGELIDQARGCTVTHVAGLDPVNVRFLDRLWARWYPGCHSSWGGSRVSVDCRNRGNASSGFVRGVWLQLAASTTAIRERSRSCRCSNPISLGKPRRLHGCRAARRARCGYAVGSRGRARPGWPGRGSRVASRILCRTR